MIKIPTKVPEKGFYYHYKHNPEKGFQNYAYEVIGVGFHTENDCWPDDAHMVVYRPLYESPIYKAGKFFDLRPLKMWMDQEVEINDVIVPIPRFTRITDKEVILKLEEVRKQMYQ